MSAVAAAAPAAVVPERAALPTLNAHRTFAGVMRGEWIKLLSLRSTWWVLGATVAIMTLVSFAAAMSLDVMAEDPLTAPALAQMHGAEIVSGGSQIGVVTIAVLGALLVTGEYSTGMIRSTLAAVPTRLPVLAAKAIVLAVVTTVVTLLSMALSYLVTTPQLTTYDLVPALDDSQTWQILGGTVYFLVAAAFFALGVGTVLRSTAGTVTVALTVLLLLPGTLGFITLDWVETIVSYLPLPAASAFLSTGDMSELGGSPLTATAGLLVVAAYAVVPLVAAAVLMRRRDA
ncbi:ABC transporter permease subunit [Cellulomonas fimi]|uniref:ABC transporter permease subunit n=1 Tax=Cellulomonas fimi TaxID=1708 RepID=A0A7Y0LZH2_CELFI|nr:ABC transporter permease subunit [Cellulomonas fimi]NMR20965.1 ABC transporter permease subunit [Cellulomonas fimi]